MVDTTQKDFLWVLGSFYLGNGKFDKALILFEALHALFPDTPRILGSLGYAALMCGREEQALEAGEAFLETAPVEWQPQAHLLMGKILWHRADKENAKNHLGIYLKTKDKHNGKR